MRAARRILIAVYDGVGLLDVTGPAEVFSAASRLAGRAAKGHRVSPVAANKGPIKTSTGISLVADESWADLEGPVSAQPKRFTALSATYATQFGFKDLVTATPFAG